MHKLNCEPFQKVTRTLEFRGRENSTIRFIQNSSGSMLDSQFCKLEFEIVKGLGI